jgi:hypothetical protein
MGAVIGCNGVYIQQAVSRFSLDMDPFFRRLLSEYLPVQSAMLLLRQCGVPRMDYLLRCIPPECVVSLAQSFDDTVMRSALLKLEIGADECLQAPHVQPQLQARLKHGGFGLRSAVRTSPCAYLASVAAPWIRRCLPTSQMKIDHFALIPSSTAGSQTASHESPPALPHPLQRPFLHPPPPSSHFIGLTRHSPLVSNPPSTSRHPSIPLLPL